MDFSLRQLWILGRAAARCVVARRPRPGWSFTEAVLVAGTRDLLRDIVELPAPVQRQRTRGPIRSAPSSVEDTSERIAGMQARRLRPPGAHDSALVLHLHGGGYVIGGSDEQSEYLGALAVASGVTMLSLDYRLAPEHAFPAAVDDAVAAIRMLIGSGQDPSKLVVIGDSAGGGLALAALLRLRDEGAQPLAGASLGSPAVDLSWPGASMKANAESDYLTTEILHVWARMYVGAADVRDPLVSPIYASHAGLPPIQYLVGDSEMLRDDVLACAEKSRRAGVDVEVVVGKDAVHCWYRIGALRYPGSADSIDHIAAFIKRCVAGAQNSVRM